MSVAPPPPYAMLGGSQRAASYRPQYQPSYRKSSSSSFACNVFRCICCCLCCVFLIFVSLGLTAFFLYTMYKPKVPTYKVEAFDVKTFDIQQDFSLNVGFQVTVRAENPNRLIGFTYGKDSQVVVSYYGTTLCTGQLPSFHQGQRNTSLIPIDLQGKIDSGSNLMQALTQNKNNQGVPLLVRVKAPISVVIGKFSLREVNALVNCSLVLDNLAPNKKIGILSTNTSYGFGF